MVTDLTILACSMEFIKRTFSFRQVAGFPIFGTGQPTEEGYKRVLEQVCPFKKGEVRAQGKSNQRLICTQVPKKLDPAIGGDGDTPLKVIWYNMRQEPVVYLDGVPYAPRHPVSVHLMTPLVGSHLFHSLF